MAVKGHHYLFPGEGSKAALLALDGSPIAPFDRERDARVWALHKPASCEVTLSLSGRQQGQPGPPWRCFATWLQSLAPPEHFFYVGRLDKDTTGAWPLDPRHSHVHTWCQPP